MKPIQCAIYAYSIAVELETTFFNASRVYILQSPEILSKDLFSSFVKKSSLALQKLRSNVHVRVHHNTESV